MFWPIEGSSAGVLLAVRLGRCSARGACFSCVPWGHRPRRGRAMTVCDVGYPNDDAHHSNGPTWPPDPRQHPVQPGSMRLAMSQFGQDAFFKALHRLRLAVARQGGIEQFVGKTIKLFVFHSNLPTV